MSDLSEIKIAIDKASKQMYEAFSSGKLDIAWDWAIEIRWLGEDAVLAIEVERHRVLNERLKMEARRVPVKRQPD